MDGAQIQELSMASLVSLFMQQFLIAHNILDGAMIVCLLHVSLLFLKHDHGYGIANFKYEPDDKYSGTKVQLLPIISKTCTLNIFDISAHVAHGKNLMMQKHTHWVPTIVRT
ncbi:hypothetical protein ACJX0J_019932 [Zea mays]